MIIASLSACAGASSLEAGSDSSKNSTSTVTTVSATTTTASSGTVEYNVLEIKDDWTTKASITFSEGGMSIDGSGCSNEDGVLYITEGGTYTLSGTSKNASILVNTDESVKLILNGVELTSEKGPVIYASQVKNLYIEMAEGTTNTLTDSDTYETDSSTGEEIGKGVISSEDDLIILGDGTLNINGNHKHGISCDDELYIESGTINITSNGTDGINANDLVCVDGGTITINAVSDGIEVEKLLVINAGTLSVTSQNEGIESKDSICINDGDITIESSDDGINAGYYIEINGGKVNVTSQNNDGIDCNGGYDGCITINDGEINVTGADSPECGLDADESSIIINGGKVTATGGSNSNIIENGGENNITSTGPEGDFQGGMGKVGPRGNGDFNPDNLPEDFDSENMPQGQKPQGEFPQKNDLQN